jgi:hypothetical protein
MPTSRLQLPAAITTLDGSGNGTVQFDGPRPGQTYTINQVSVFIPNSTKIPTFNYYHGAAVPQNFISGTVTGNQDTDSIPNTVLHPGEFLTGVWVGGTPGSVASMVVSGDVDY